MFLIYVSTLLLYVKSFSEFQTFLTAIHIGSTDDLVYIYIDYYI